MNRAQGEKRKMVDEQKNDFNVKKKLEHLERIIRKSSQKKISYMLACNCTFAESQIQSSFSTIPCQRMLYSLGVSCNQICSSVWIFAVADRYASLFIGIKLTFFFQKSLWMFTINPMDREKTVQIHLFIFSSILFQKNCYTVEHFSTGLSNPCFANCPWKYVLRGVRSQKGFWK